MISLTSAMKLTSPVFFEVNIALELRCCNIRFETSTLKNLDHAGRLRISHRAGLPVSLRNSNHFRISTKENVSFCGIEVSPKLLFEFSARNDILDVNLASQFWFASGQGQVFEVGISAHQAI